MLRPPLTVINSCSGSNPVVQHCPEQSHWLQRKHQKTLQQVAVVKSARRLTFAWDIHYLEFGFCPAMSMAALGEQLCSKTKSKKNCNAPHHHSYKQSSQQKFLGKADTKILAKFHWSSALFFFFFSSPYVHFLCSFPRWYLRTLFMKWNYWSET